MHTQKLNLLKNAFDNLFTTPRIQFIYFENMSLAVS